MARRLLLRLGAQVWSSTLNGSRSNIISDNLDQTPEQTDDKKMRSAWEGWPARRVRLQLFQVISFLAVIFDGFWTTMYEIIPIFFVIACRRSGRLTRWLALVSVISMQFETFLGSTLVHRPLQP